MSTEIAFDFDKARFNMIEQQIRPWNVHDAKVLAALQDVKREQFVSGAHKTMALADLELPLGKGVGQSMLFPKVDARLLQDLALQSTDNVLEIGTGSGYTTALLARMAAKVTSFEIDPSLAQQAREHLQAAGVKNAEVRTADAAADHFAACRQAGPFDAILLGGSVAEVPEDLLALLKNGGRLFAVVGQNPTMRATLIRSQGGHLHTSDNWDICLPRLQNFPVRSQFKF